MHRRHFLALAAGSLGAAALPPSRPALALSPAVRLAATTRILDINGRPGTAYGLMQPDGRQGAAFMAGGNFRVDLTNALSEPTLIHWHGLEPPWAQDGVPGLPLPLLQPWEMRSYDFPLARPGTYWMHAHTLQEQGLLAAPLIVHDPADQARDEQEVVILLHDFSFRTPEELLAGVKGRPGTALQPMDHAHTSAQPGMDMSHMDMGGMAMDVNDFQFDAYLANDRTLDDPEVVRVERGGRVRLRIINGATATGYTIDTGTLDATVMAVDGTAVEPLVTRQFPLAMGQRVDLRLALPAAAGAFPILARREGAKERAGIILATAGAAIPRLAVMGTDDGPLLTLAMEQRLRTANPLPAPAGEAIPFEAHLFGNMESYDWGMMLPTPLKVKAGQRATITMHNMSMMMHPMHLHGHHFQVVEINGTPLAGAVRDTVIVPPMAKVTIAFDAANPGGGWPFHCHNLYHMASGMMTTMAYDGA